METRSYTNGSLLAARSAHPTDFRVDVRCFGAETGRDRSRSITANDILDAQEQLIRRRETRLDQLADKLQEDRVRRVVEPLLSGGNEGTFTARDLEYVRDLGLVTPDAPPHIANPIYAEVVPRELTSAAQEGLVADAAWCVSADGLVEAHGMHPSDRCYRPEPNSAEDASSRGP